MDLCGPFSALCIYNDCFFYIGLFSIFWVKKQIKSWLEESWKLHVKDTLGSDLHKAIAARFVDIRWRHHVIPIARRSLQLHRSLIATQTCVGLFDKLPALRSCSLQDVQEWWAAVMCGEGKCDAVCVCAFFIAVETNFACASSKLWSVMVMIWCRMSPMSCFLPSPSVPSCTCGGGKVIPPCTEWPAMFTPAKVCNILVGSSILLFDQLKNRL